MLGICPRPLGISGAKKEEEEKDVVYFDNENFISLKD
jgi:hypothetical protein